MAYTPIDSILGIQPIAVSSTTQNHPEGLIVNAYDATLGGGEFIYLKGVASTIVGSLVVYDPVNHTTTLAPNTANLDQPCAVAMSANVALAWGWYQVAGAAVIKKTAFSVNPNVPVYLSSTTGRVAAAQANGKQVVNARTVNAATVASATSTVTVLVQRPFLQGQTA